MRTSNFKNSILEGCINFDCLNVKNPKSNKK